jgi:hypothetical protein
MHAAQSSFIFFPLFLAYTFFLAILSFFIAMHAAQSSLTECLVPCPLHKRHHAGIHPHQAQGNLPQGWLKHLHNTRHAHKIKDNITQGLALH